MIFGDSTDLFSGVATLYKARDRETTDDAVLAREWLRWSKSYRGDHTSHDSRLNP